MQYSLETEMKAPDLFLLIKGLSRNEKSYYKKLAKRHATENCALHLKLFQLIAQSKVYDEELLCAELKIENKIHFSALKTYLHKDILESLVFLRRNELVDSQLYFMLEEIRALLEKRLLNLALRICDKAIIIATQYDKYTMLVLILHLRNQVIKYKNCKEYYATLNIELSKLEEAIHHQEILFQNKILFEKVKSLNIGNCRPITDEQKCRIYKEKKRLQSIKPSGDQQVLILLYYLNTLAICQCMLNENKSFIATCSKLYSLWQSSSHLINEESSLFLSSIKTTCHMHFSCSDHRFVLEKLSGYNALAGNLKNEIYVKHIEVIRFETELKFYLTTAKFWQVKRMVDNKAATMFSNSAEALSPSDQLSIGCTICIALFVLERWDESETLLNVIKKQNKHVKREDILYFSCLFLILILFEKKHWDRLYNVIESSYQFLHTRKKVRGFEREMILFIKRLSSSNCIDNSKQLIKKFLAHLGEYKSDSDKNLYFLYFDYFGWLESKLMDLRFMDYLRLQNPESPSANMEVDKGGIV